MLIVGSQVYYSQDGNVHPAIVLKAHSATVADLVVFGLIVNDDEEKSTTQIPAKLMWDIEFSKNYENGFWSWAPRPYNQ